jgi:hypothetical protein
MIISAFVQLNRFLEKVKDVFLQILSLLSLGLTYLLGVGLTRLVSILVGKRFLPPVTPNSQWQATEYSDKVSKNMY